MAAASEVPLGNAKIGLIDADTVEGDLGHPIT
jgi:hypothetical protein